MLFAKDMFVNGKLGGVLIAGGDRIPCMPGPIGKVAPCGQSVRMIESEHPFANRQ
jgi:hypothetical protein